MVFERHPPLTLTLATTSTTKKRQGWGLGGGEGGVQKKKKKNQREIGRMLTFRGCGTVELSRPKSCEKKWRQPECKLNPPHSCKYCLSH